MSRGIPLDALPPAVRERALAASEGDAGRRRRSSGRAEGPEPDGIAYVCCRCGERFERQGRSTALGRVERHVDAEHGGGRYELAL